MISKFSLHSPIIEENKVAAAALTKGLWCTTASQRHVTTTSCIFNSHSSLTVTSKQSKGIPQRGRAQRNRFNTLLISSVSSQLLKTDTKYTGIMFKLGQYWLKLDSICSKHCTCERKKGRILCFVKFLPNNMQMFENKLMKLLSSILFEISTWFKLFNKSGNL